MKKLALVLFTLFITLAIPELVIRLIWENNDWWVTQPTPPSPEFPVNQYGFRDYEYSIKKPENTVRIICLGDSFTWGDGVEFDDTYPKRLERSLNLRQGRETGKKYEVLNISWRGHSTTQEAAELDRVLLFQPDMIVLGYCLNDSEDWSNPQAIRSLRQRYLFPREPGPALRTLYRRWSLFSFLANRLSNLRISRGTISYYKHIYDEDYPGWHKARAALRIFSREKTPILVVIFPLLSYDLNHYPFHRIHKKVHLELKKLSLVYLDILNILHTENHIRLEAVPYRNPHPSEIAHHLIAKSLYQTLIEQFGRILL